MPLKPSGYKPLRLQAHVKPFTSLHKPWAYKRHFTVCNFYCIRNLEVQSFKFVYRRKIDLNVFFLTTKMIICPSLIFFYQKTDHVNKSATIFHTVLFTRVRYRGSYIQQLLSLILHSLHRKPLSFSR